jgi:bifunctional enzyme CysN/CysC
MDLLRLLTCGSVDDGKSTLIGRLLHDSQRVADDQLEKLARDSKRIGSAGDDIDFALLCDGLHAEREQGITIDVAYRYFETPRRKFIIADCPGHVQYTRNMVTGASTANLAILLVDAERGVLEQSRRHAFICSLLDIGHLVVAVNKMDRVGWSRPVFEEIRDRFSEFASRLAVRDLHYTPISALLGDNVVTPSANMPWHRDPPLLEILERTHIASDRNLIDLRFPVQLALRPDPSYRGFAGSVASGILRPGSEVVVLPSRQRTRVAEVTTFDGPVEQAVPPQAVSVVLADEVDVSRGDVLAHPHNLPRMSRTLECNLVWLSETPSRVNQTYRLKHAAVEVRAEIEALRYEIDVTTLARTEAPRLELNDIGRARLGLDRSLVHDPYTRNRTTGSFILIDPIDNGTVAAGMILDRASVDDPADTDTHGGGSTHVRPAASRISTGERVERAGHTPAVLWLTGLPASGKSTTAHLLERRLFDLGARAQVIDGENLRLGLSSDLGFSAIDRAESNRRAAHVASMLADGGAIAIVALVSPFAADRRRAAEIAGADRFHLIWTRAPVDACAERDPRGLYDRARSGAIAAFTGVSSPYQEPDDADLIVDTAALDPEAAVDAVMAYLEQRGLLP